MKNLRKMKEFNQKMGRAKYSNGGYIRKIGNRHYFAAGGNTSVAPTTLTGIAPSNGQGGVPGASGITGAISQGLGLQNQFQAGSANITPGTNVAQLNNSYTGATNALGNQQNIVNTLTPQVANAVTNQNAVANQQLAIMNGSGPNPAQAAFNQNTAQNIAQQAALNASVRGAGTNAGLVAEQNANVGAATQQNAVGQEATNAANQQIAAAQNLSNLTNQQINQTGQATTNLNSAQQGEQGILQNSNTAYNNAQVGMQSNINNVNSQIATANQNMNANVLGGITSALSGGSIASMFKNKGGVINLDDGGQVDEGTFKPSADSSQGPNIAQTSTLPADNTNFSEAVSGGSGKGGSGGGGLGSIVGSIAALFADGGYVNQGTFNPSAPVSTSGPNIPSTSALPADATNLSKSVNKKKSPPQQQSQQQSQTVSGGAADSTPGGSPPPDAGASSIDNSETENAAHGGIMIRGGNRCHGPHGSHVANFMFASGGQTNMVPAMVSPGERYLNPDEVRKVVENGENPMKLGKVYGGKPKVKGDSLKNDTIPDDLQEGGVVIPRHVETKKNRHMSENFVHRAIHMKRPVQKGA